MRYHPAIVSRFGPHPADPFWEAKDQCLAFRSAILLNSASFNRAARPVPIAQLAKAAGLSTRAAHMMIDCGLHTGDLLRVSYAEDGRLRHIEPTNRLLQRSIVLSMQWFDMMSRFTDRPNPMSDADPPALARALRVVLELFLDDGEEDFGRRTNFYPKALHFTLIDLILDGPSHVSEFVVKEAKLLGVTSETVRNAIARARELGWLKEGGILVPTERALQAYSNVFSTLNFRWNNALDLVERDDLDLRAPPGMRTRRSIHKHSADDEAYVGGDQIFAQAARSSLQAFDHV
jgi:hypothetical protein